MFRRHDHPWWKSFVYAFYGIRRVFFRERNFRFHVAIAGMVMIAGVLLKIDWQAWIGIIFAIAFVLTIETINTAFEELCDRVKPGKDTSIRRIKDIMAGAVLIATVGSIGVGIFVFFPYVWGWLMKLIGSK